MSPMQEDRKGHGRQSSDLDVHSLPADERPAEDSISTLHFAKLDAA